MSGTVIAIDRMPLHFVAASSPDRAEQISRRICDTLARALPLAIASAFGRELETGDEYVFIDRCDVQCSASSNWSDDAIATMFAGRLVCALVRERSMGEPLVFRDRAEFLAAFIGAAVDGHAFSRWWFEEFKGLSPLPISTCIRTLVANEGWPAWQALGRFAPDSLCRVVSVLNQADAERMLANLPGDSSGKAATARALIAAIDSARSLPLPGQSHVLIAALSRLTREDGAAGFPANLAALRAILDAAIRGELRCAGQRADVDPMADWCHAARVIDPDKSVAPSIADRDAVLEFTPFGGALVLAVVLVRCGWWIAWRDALAEQFGERATSVAAWLALAISARALMPQHPASVERDPVLRRVFGVPDEPRPLATDRATKRALQAALVSGGSTTALDVRARYFGAQLRRWGRELVRECGRRIPGCDGANAVYLREQCLVFPATVAPDGSARVGRPPLDVLLVFSGLKRARVTLPDGRTLALFDEVGL